MILLFHPLLMKGQSISDQSYLRRTYGAGTTLVNIIEYLRVQLGWRRRIIWGTMQWAGYWR